MEKIDEWLVCGCVWELVYHKIHPEDLEKFLEIVPDYKVFQCIGKEEEFRFLQRGKDVYRVKESMLIPVEEPRFKIGETVIVAGKNEEALVVDISWHYNLKEPFYALKINDKTKKKRYFTEDLRYPGEVL